MAPKPLQTRAEETRRSILAAAVDLFDNIGYAKTGLNDIVKQSGLTKGAFYYHFDSKEAVATAVIEEMDRRATAATAGDLESGPPSLEHVIRFTFAVQRLMIEDPVVHVGRLLVHANNQASSTGPATNLNTADTFVELARPVIDEFGPHPGVDSGDIAEVLWLALTGHHLVAAACRDDATEGFARVAQVWKVMLPILVPADQVDRYRDAVDRIADGYALDDHALDDHAQDDPALENS